MNELRLHPTLHSSVSSFDEIMSLQGEIFRALESRSTHRVLLQQHSYFLKKHFGCTWKEIFKNLLQGKLPILDAKTEFRALHHLHALEVPVPEVVGFGCRGRNPLTRQSFLLTRELPSHVSLEDFCKNWKINPPPFLAKYTLIQKVAEIARTMHTAGINHRDFYICHFLLKINMLHDVCRQNCSCDPCAHPCAQGSTNIMQHICLQKIEIYLIDLHRAQCRAHVPDRWLIKDLAGLYFSTKTIGLTSRDLLRFIKIYRGSSLRFILKKEAYFWQKVKNRGEKLFQKHCR